MWLKNIFFYFQQQFTQHFNESGYQCLSSKSKSNSPPFEQFNFNWFVCFWHKYTIGPVHQGDQRVDCRCHRTTWSPTWTPTRSTYRSDRWTRCCAWQSWFQLLCRHKIQLFQVRILIWYLRKENTYTLVARYLHTPCFQENILSILTTFLKESKNKWYLIWKP